MSEANFFYFGCEPGQTGHYLFQSGGRYLGHRNAPKDCPWPIPDGNLAPRSAPQYRRDKGHELAQGICALHQKDGWTAISFWDRSEDHRGASNSTFMGPGTHDFETMMALARKHFPEIVTRAEGNFEIRMLESK